jgi:hypothetical protein
MSMKRRTFVRAATAAAAGGSAIGTVAASTQERASGDHPKTEHIEYGWSPAQPYRWIPAAPSVAIHAEEAGGWWEVCIEHSDVYAEHVVETHSMWGAFNDIDAVEGNIQWHYFTVLEPDDEIATIDLWERHNPLVPFNNVFDAEQQVDSHDDYDSIDGGGTSVRDEWEASVGDLTVF